MSVEGLTFRRRILWVPCRCGKKHYICLSCARRIGSEIAAGIRYVAACAKGYYRRRKRELAARKGGKGA